MTLPSQAPVKPQDAAFYATLMSAHAPSVSAVMLQASIASDMTSLSAAMDVIEARFLLGTASETLAGVKWLCEDVSSSIRDDLSDFAKGKRMMKGAYSTGFKNSPSESLAQALWSVDPGRSSVHCNRIELDEAQAAHLARAGRLMRAIQEKSIADAGPDEQPYHRPFDEFFCAAIAGVRNREALQDLMTLEPDWERRHITSGYRVKLNMGSQTVTPANVAAIEVNPSAIAAILEQHKVKAIPQALKSLADSFACREGADRWCQPDTVVDALQVERSTAKFAAEDSLLGTLEKLLMVLDRESRTDMLCGWLCDSLLKNVRGGLTEMRDVSKALWSMGGPEFIEDMRENKKLESLLSFSAAASFLPALKAFGPEIEHLALMSNHLMRRTYHCGAEITTARVSWSDVDLAKEAAMGVIGSAHIPLDDFAKAAEILCDRGWSFSRLRLEKGDGLLHSMATLAKTDNDLGAMIKLVELGCDPLLCNDRNWKPASNLDKALRPQWENLVRSHKARHAARDAIADIAGEMGLRSALFM